MPSTIGHALAGAAVAWGGDAMAAGREPASRDVRGLTVAAALIAAAPDLDLLADVHRTFTHSLVMSVAVGAVAAVVAVRLRVPVLRVALVCAAAHASHILLDWLAVDNYPPRGVQALWPFSQEFLISGAGIFRQTQRRAFFSLNAIWNNGLAVAQELAILVPVACVVWLVRIKALARFPAQMAGRDHPA